VKPLPAILTGGINSHCARPRSAPIFPTACQHARLVIACTLDAAGNLKNVRVLEAWSRRHDRENHAALRSWKFQPAMRGDQPVEVTAILGFGIDTNDRN
jgi:iron complex outermembrane recepter protein